MGLRIIEVDGTYCFFVFEIVKIDKKVSILVDYTKKQENSTKVLQKNK